MLETFSIIEAAGALGKSGPNFRRWVNEDLIPKPVLRETTRGHYVYSREELEIILLILLEHEKEYVYFGASHTVTSNKIHQAILGHRDILYNRATHGRGK